METYPREVVEKLLKENEKIKAENQRVWEQLERLVKSEAIREAPALWYSEVYITASQMVEDRLKFQ